MKVVTLSHFLPLLILTFSVPIMHESFLRMVGFLLAPNFQYTEIYLTDIRVLTPNIPTD